MQFWLDLATRCRRKAQSYRYIAKRNRDARFRELARQQYELALWALGMARGYRKAVT